MRVTSHSTDYGATGEILRERSLLLVRRGALARENPIGRVVSQLHGGYLYNFS